MFTETKSQRRKAFFPGFLIITISVINSAAITHVVNVKDLCFDRAYKCKSDDKWPCLARYLYEQDKVYNGPRDILFNEN